jgi:hypothetical protein
MDKETKAWDYIFQMGRSDPVGVILDSGDVLYFDPWDLEGIKKFIHQIPIDSELNGGEN